MRRRGNELGRADARWDSRDIFGQRRRRRIRWLPIVVVAIVAAGAFALSDARSRDRLQGLWGEIFKPAPAAAPQGDDQLSILPLPPEPPGAQ